MKKQLCQVVFSLPLFLLCACGAGRTLILQPAQSGHVFPAAELQHNGSTAEVPDEVIEAFETRVTEKLAEGGLPEGPELKLLYRFIQLEEGSQLARWFWGGIGNAGEGSLTIEVFYRDDSDIVLAQIQAEGRIGSGAFGGSFKDALNRAADEVAEYTLKNFALPLPEDAKPEM